jgi:hypothetical protein
MFKNYLATDEDLKTIEEGISFVWKSELDYIFKDKSRIASTIVVSYDSSTMYIFQHDKPMQKVAHAVEIDESFLKGWSAGLYPEGLYDYLPNDIKDATSGAVSFISGPLLYPMLDAQKKSKRFPNAYTTKESYLATLVHEFGHIYFNSFKAWYFSDLNKNISYMNTALALFGGSSLGNLELPNVQFPLYDSMGEVFAFCTDYSSASVFWPDHKKDIDNMNVVELKDIIEKEGKLNLNEEDSYLSESRYGPHLLAAVSGKILISKNPTNWPDIILGMNSL